MDDRPPLSALLSRALVAFIIEFDNEFELRTPHRTGRFGGARPDPWLVSMVMWMRFLRFVPDEGIAARELPKRWGLSVPETRQWGARLSKWWGYVVPGPIVRLTPGGRRASEVWRGLTAEIEQRWRERFDLAPLMQALAKTAKQDLPDHLPILGFGLWSKPDALHTPTDTLPGLLSKVLLDSAIEYESQSAVSLAIGANVLRLVPDDGVRLRDLPRLAGVSKEAVAMATGFLARQSFARTGAGRTFQLTEKGREAREEYGRLAEAIERKWNVPELRAALESLTLATPEPPPGTWRSKVARPEVLPDFPMILHRGAYPDGS